MNIQATIRALLLESPEIREIVGYADQARVWTLWPRTYSVPCVVIEEDIENEQNDLDGGSIGVIADVTLTVRAASHEASHALWELVRARLATLSCAEACCILDNTVHSATPKSDGSTDHWYDHVMSLTVMW